MIKFWIVDDGVPDRTASADLPPLATLPGLGREFHFRMLKGLRGIARDRKESPDFIACLGIVSGDVTAHAELCAAVTDINFTFCRSGCAGDAVVAFGIDDGVDFPDLLAAARVDGHQAAIQRADVDLTLVNSHASIDRSAAGASHEILWHHGIVAPLLDAGLGIHGMYNREGRGKEHRIIDDNRCCL